MFRLAAVVVAFALPLALHADGTAPSGWHLSGSDVQAYEAAVDNAVRHSGTASGSLEATAAAPEGFGTLMQTAQPGSYAGRRVKYSAYVRTSGVENWAGLWFRVDGPDEQQPLAFDNMHDRPIKADTDWKSYSVVLDVPTDATALAYGVLLVGPGRVWIDDAKIEAVETGAPTTGNARQALAATPANLGFEE